MGHNFLLNCSTNSAKSITSNIHVPHEARITHKQNGEAESGVCIAKKILKQSDAFVNLMSYSATSHTATGVSPSQKSESPSIPTLTSNLKPICYEAVAERDKKK